MTTVVGSGAQPAIGPVSATVPDARDEKALPRSESGVERNKPSDYCSINQLDKLLWLNDTNWMVWRIDMIYVFQLCGVELRRVVAQPSLASASHKQNCADLIVFLCCFMFPVQHTHIHQVCIARRARNVTTVPSIVVTADNLVVMSVGDLDMALATVGKQR